MSPPVRFQLYTECEILKDKTVTPFRQTVAEGYPITNLDRALVPQDVRLPQFPGSRDKKVLRLSALHIGCLYSTEDIPSTHYC